MWRLATAFIPEIHGEKNPWTIFSSRGTVRFPLQRSTGEPSGLGKQVNSATRELSMIVRSAMFQLAFAATIIVYSVIIPLMFLRRRWAAPIMSSLLQTLIALMRVICGLSYEIRGTQHLSDGPMLVASKHQSACDSLILAHILNNPVVVMKRELERIPVFGSILLRLGHIAVDRSGDARSLAAFVHTARGRVERGRSIIMFPEGTRCAPFEVVEYRPGVGVLYRELGIPCIPVALNSGHYWPPRSWRRYPGRIVIEFLEPIAPGQRNDKFLELLRQRIDAATSQLVPRAPTQS
jgi:1-acyl-sn-glycerol-3-phosphate acyltransferase